MTKLRNKIVLVLLALCLVACMGITVACGGNDTKKPTNKSVTYTVTVQIDGSAVKGVKVTVKKGGVSFPSKLTGDDGKAEFSLAQADDYTVELEDLPENYEVPEGASLTFPADRNLTVNLAEKFAYKIKLVNPDGTAFYSEDVTVGICKDGTCLTPVAIDANGLARKEAEKDDYHIKIFGLPVGYAYECDAEGYSVHQTDDGTYIYEGADNTYNSLSATVTEQTIKVYPVEEIKLVDEAKLTPEQKEELYINGNNAYKMTVKVPANSVAYYVYNVEYTGVYYLRYNADANITVHVNPTYLRGNNSLGRNIVGTNGDTKLTKGEVKYINIANNSDEEATVDLIMATPSFTYATVDGAGTVDVTFYKENVTSVIELQPTIGAKFKATVQGDAVAAIASSNTTIYDYQMQNEYGAFASDENSYGTGKYCEFKFTEDRIGGSVYLAVCAKAETYPVTVSVKIEKTADVHNTINNVTTTDTLVKYNRPANKELVPLPFDIDGETELVKKEDGYYYYKDKIVMVMLTGDLDFDRFSKGGALVYMELATEGRVSPYVVDITSDEDRESLDKGNTYDDYREVLRGFKDYKYDKQNNPSVPNTADILVDKYYAKDDFVNEDGAYPLTDKLINILKVITEQIRENHDMLLPQIDNSDNLWMFACYYYDDYIEPDVIMGEYKFVTKVEGGERISVGDQEAVDWDIDGNTIYKTYTADTYKLVIERRHKFAIYEQNADEDYEEYDTYKGSWSKNDFGIYTFTVSVMGWDEDWNIIYTNWTFSATYNETTGAFMLVADDDTEWEFTKKPSQAGDVIVGEYVSGSGVDLKSLVVKGNGTYVMKDSNGKLTGTWEKKENGKYKFIENNPSWGKVEYEVTRNAETGALSFYDVEMEEDIGEFTIPGSGGDDEEAPDFATLYSTQMSPKDETIAQAKLGLYNDGKCVLWQFSFITKTYEKIATATWSASQDGTEVTITNITVMEDYEFTVTAEYNVDTQNMVGVISISLHQGEGEDEYITPYTFQMPLQA